MPLVTLTARPRVSNAFVSAFYLWFQDHTLPTEQMLRLEIALLAPASPFFSAVSQQMAATGSSTVLGGAGCMDKVKKRCVELAAAQ